MQVDSPSCKGFLAMGVRICEAVYSGYAQFQFIQIKYETVCDTHGKPIETRSSLFLEMTGTKAMQIKFHSQERRTFQEWSCRGLKLATF